MRRTLVALLVLLAGCAPRQQPDQRTRTPAERPVPSDERETAILNELNAVRTDPAGYAAHLEARLPHYRDNVLRMPGSPAIRTFEGAKAVREAIGALRAASPAGAVQAARGLTLAARDHVGDIGPKGLLSHEGSGGTTPQQRIARYAERYNYIGENISFGPEQPRDVILDLLIDDNVPGRGHRKILLDPRFRYAGAACGHHAIYRTVCVLDLAGDYADKT